MGITGIVSAGDSFAPFYAETKSKVDPVLHQVQANSRGIYIIGFRAPPLAMYDGRDPRFAAIARNANGRLDVSSSAARAYVDHLRQQQQQFLSKFSASVGRNVTPRNPQFQFQHAFNGMVLELSPAELEVVRRDPEVVHLEGYTEYALDTDVGPQWIGAPAIWDGSATPNGFSSRGEGIVIGVIDSGANLGSPSFTATDLDGYTHTNPLGAGNYLGWCNPTHPNHNPTRDICNSKVIGGWDFSDNQITGTNREAAGFEDENGHGSHTAGTAGGNKRNAVINGVAVQVQGVAPRANLVIYDACYTNAAGNGLCGNDATLASINQAVADGVVDVINYSISGGAQPWVEANSLAFLAAHNAGIFVSASAGNSGPGAATVAHNEPWVATVAASTHGRVTFGFPFSLTTPSDPTTTDMWTRTGANPPLNNTLPLVDVPVIKSPTFDNASNNDGCAAFPADTFSRGGTRGIALIHWRNGASACGTVARANAAVAAGADAVVFIPETIGSLNAAGGANAPVFVVLRGSDKDALLSAVDGAPTSAEGGIPDAGQAFLGGGDSMANFSSRGPNTFDFLKPDVSAPGVQILAAVARWNTLTAPGSLNPALNDAVGLLNGTSMSSPHNAGAAALVKAVNRSWRPMQIKSALMTTGTDELLKEDEQTPADPFDFGAGRIDVSRAVQAGFLMDETGANFAAANPATGGDPSALNLPSFQKQSCVGVCTFPRTVRGTRSGVTWTASIEGLPAGVASVSPASISPTPTANTSFTLSVDSQLLPANQWSFGFLVWTPSNPALPVKRMPIVVRAASPRLQASETSVEALLAEQETAEDIFSSSFEAGETPRTLNPSSASFQLTLSNAGNPTLNWTYATGLQPATVLNQGPQLGNGFRGSEHNSSEANTGYAADDFDLLTPGRVTFLRSDGFVLPNGSPLTASNSINFRIYADANGSPAGAPRPNGINVGDLPVWSASLPANTPGISFNAGGTVGNISLDLQTAGLTAPVLPAGKYWVLVYPNLPGSGSGATGNPLWAAAIVGIGAPLNGLAPLVRGGTATSNWAIPSLAGAPGPGPVSGFSMRVNADVTCGASWLSVDTPSGSLGLAESQQVNLTVDSAGLAQGVYRALACFSSNSLEPTVVVAVEMTVASTDTNPTVQVAVSPTTVNNLTASQLTFTLGNSSITPLTSSAPFEVSLPAGLEIANPSGAATTCPSGSVSATAGGPLISLAAGAQLAPASTCLVQVNVRSSTIGTYLIEVPAGALQTNPGGGSNQDAASATLTVRAPIFPEPYCSVAFPDGIEPISLVDFAGINNVSPATIGAGGALQDFTAITGTLAAGASATMRVKGNTDGAFSSAVRAYIDWNGNGLFTDAGEAFNVGTLTNSTGEDAVEASASITVPAGTAPGNKRLRVIKQFNAVSGPCNTAGYGQAEDYTLTVN